MEKTKMGSYRNGWFYQRRVRNKQEQKKPRQVFSTSKSKKLIKGIESKDCKKEESFWRKETIRSKHKESKGANKEVKLTKKPCYKALGCVLRAFLLPGGFVYQMGGYVPHIICFQARTSNIKVK